MSLDARIDHWLFDAFAVDARGLALYRIAFASFCLLFLAPGHEAYFDFVALASLPDVFFLPPVGPMRLFDGAPSAAMMQALLAGLYVALVALLVGYRTRLASLATFVFLGLGLGFSYSFGKINHSILLLLVPLLMAGSGWGAAWSYDARHGAGRAGTPQGWPLALLALLLGFGMCTAGIAKLIGGWLDPSTQAAYGHVVKQVFVGGRTDLLATTALGIQAPWLWEASDWATVAFEVGFLAAVWRPATTRLFAALAVLFHLNVMLTLNIAFALNLIVYAAFVDWPGVARRVARWVPEGHAHGAAWISAGVLAGAACWAWGSPLLALDAWLPLESDLTGKDVVFVGAAAAGVVVALGRAGLDAARRGRDWPSGARRRRPAVSSTQPSPGDAP